MRNLPIFPDVTHSMSPGYGKVALTEHIAQDVTSNRSLPRVRWWSHSVRVVNAQSVGSTPWNHETIVGEPGPKRLSLPSTSRSSFKSSQADRYLSDYLCRKRS